MYSVSYEDKNIFTMNSQLNHLVHAWRPIKNHSCVIYQTREKVFHRDIQTP